MTNAAALALRLEVSFSLAAVPLVLCAGLFGPGRCPFGTKNGPGAGSFLLVAQELRRSGCTQHRDPVERLTLLRLFKGPARGQPDGYRA